MKKSILVLVAMSALLVAEAQAGRRSQPSGTPFSQRLKCGGQWIFGRSGSHQVIDLNVSFNLNSNASNMEVISRNTQGAETDLYVGAAKMGNVPSSQLVGFSSLDKQYGVFFRKTDFEQRDSFQASMIIQGIDDPVVTSCKVLK